jgi:hypothetical protein
MKFTQLFVTHGSSFYLVICTMPRGPFALVIRATKVDHCLRAVPFLWVSREQSLRPHPLFVVFAKQRQPQFNQNRFNNFRPLVFGDSLLGLTL